jgi:hypothetical protein
MDVEVQLHAPRFRPPWPLAVVYRVAFACCALALRLLRALLDWILPRRSRGEGMHGVALQRRQQL